MTIKDGKVTGAVKIEVKGHGADEFTNTSKVEPYHKQEKSKQSESARYLLCCIHQIEEQGGSWLRLLQLLNKSKSKAQELLLESVRWQLRGQALPEDYIPMLTDILLHLSQEGQPSREKAIQVLGYLPRPSSVVVENLICWAQEKSPPESLWQSLARLATTVENDRSQKLAQVLRSAPSTSGVIVALVRYLLGNPPNFASMDAMTTGTLHGPSSWITEDYNYEGAEDISFFGTTHSFALRQSKKDEWEPTHFLITLAEAGLEPVLQLNALLGAAQDDDPWNNYHDRVVQSVHLLVEQEADLFHHLIMELKRVINGRNGPYRRILLAAIARCAEAMPAQFNEKAETAEPLLLQATQSLESHDSRRFAITALSYLREISPAVLEALLRLAGDVESVQSAVIVAAGQFNRLHPSLGEALPQALVEALHGQSSIAAYVAVQLLEALGTSRAAAVTPGLRRQIIQALAAALNNKRCDHPVWLYKQRTFGDGSEILQEGILEQHLYQALLRVSGFRS